MWLDQLQGMARSEVANTAGSQYPTNLLHKRVRISDVLIHMVAHCGVEAFVAKWQRRAAADKVV